jgi:hypothetical protein
VVLPIREHQQGPRDQQAPGGRRTDDLPKQEGDCETGQPTEKAAACGFFLI